MVIQSIWNTNPNRSVSEKWYHIPSLSICFSVLSPSAGTRVHYCVIIIHMFRQIYIKSNCPICNDTHGYWCLRASEANTLLLPANKYPHSPTPRENVLVLILISWEHFKCSLCQSRRPLELVSPSFPFAVFGEQISVLTIYSILPCIANVIADSCHLLAKHFYIIWWNVFVCSIYSPLSSSPTTSPLKTIANRRSRRVHVRWIRVIVWMVRQAIVKMTMNRWQLTSEVKSGATTIQRSVRHYY